MPKYISNRDLSPIETILAARPEGWGIGEIEKALKSQGMSLNRRTLQRRLALLEKQGRIQIVGAGRATRYLTLVTPDKTNETRGGILLSTDAREIEELISRPLTARHPVGYQRKFIDSYEPNVSWYLQPAIRNHLKDIGRRTGIDYAAGTYIRQILGRLLIDLSWASSRLEGNTYSLLETERLIAFGESAPGKTPFETQMVLNHKAAIEFLVDAADETGFDRRTILNIHALLSDNLLGDPKASGRLRAIPVSIGKSVYEPLAMPQLIDELFSQILSIASAISDPYEQAFFVTVHLPYLQPFEDVNKRVSRLAANIPLIRHNLCPLSFLDVPEDQYINGLLGVYELNRTELLRDVFVWTYERSCQRYHVVRHALGEPDAFRLRYRNALMDCVGEVIRQVGQGKAADEGELLSHLVEDRVVEDDREHFLKIVKEELAA
ncbi:MAG: Fic family protein, partial [Desulfobacterales bacterium]